MKKASRQSFLNSIASVVFSVLIIAAAYFHGQANLAKAQVDNSYYTSYQDTPDHYMCYVCPVPPPGGGGGGGGGGDSCNFDGVCDEGETTDSCPNDCQTSIIRANTPKSNLAQSYAYDDAGYHAGSDCPDYQGSWQDCPNQPVHQCNGACNDACGGPDGCGGTCGDVCNIGCASANSDACSGGSTCQSPTSQTYTDVGAPSSNACGTGRSFSTGTQTYSPFNNGGSVTATKSKVPPPSPRYNYYCSQSFISSPSGSSCAGVIDNFNPANISQGNTVDTGTYTVGVSYWWDVVMENLGYMDCDAPTDQTPGNDYGSTPHPDYAVYPSASSWFISQNPPHGLCSNIAYICERSDQPTPGQCGHEVNLDSHYGGLPNLVANFSPSMVQHTGHASYYNEQATSNNGSVQGAGGNAATTHPIGSHPGVADPSKIDGSPINGWIPIGGTTWYVFRQINDCPWAPDWPPQQGDPRISSYSGCDLPPTYSAYCIGSTCTPASDPSGSYSYTPAFCPSGKAGVAIDTLSFTRNSSTGALSNTNTPDYGFCYAAPSVAVTQLGCGTNQVKVDWSAVTDNKHSPTRYQIKRDGTVLSSSVTTTTYTDTLGDSSSHTYTVSVISTVSGPDSGRTGPDALGATGSASGTAPAICAASAPSALGATVDSQTQITLNWTDNSSSETGFKIERSTDNSSWSAVTTTAANATSYANTGLSANTLYYYRVRSTNAGGDSANSNTASATTLPNAPGAPTGFTGTASAICQSKSISLSWTAPAGATSYTLKRGSTTIYTGANTSYDDSVAADNTSYSYTVTASNSGGTSAAASISATSPQICPKTTTGFTATVPNSPTCGADWVNLAFYNDAVDSYNVKDGSTSIFNQPSGNITWQTDSNGKQYYAFSATSLTPASGHTYTVFLTNSGGTSSATASPVTPTTVEQICAAAAPSSLSVTVDSQSQLTLHWTDNSSSETGFKIERSTDNSSWSAVTTTAANATSYANTGLSANTLYYYRVRSTNAGGDSANSNTASATTLPNAPGAPASLTPTPAACGTGTMNLAWAASSGATSYTLKRGSTTLYTGANLAFTDTGLTSSTNYSYTVTASNSGGTSAATSNSASAPPDCTGLTLTADDASVPYDGATTIHWTPAHATACTASDGWSGAKATGGGTQSTGAIEANTTYSLSCTGPSGTVDKSVTVNVIPRSSITVNDNIASGWTINPGGLTGTGAGLKTVAPGVGGTTYTITPSAIDGYDYPPAISNSIGGGSSLLLFGGETPSFTLNYAKSFNYTLSNGGNVTVEKGGFDQFGQVAIHETLTQDSGPSQSVSLSLTGVPSGVSYNSSTCSPGSKPNCDSTVTFTVTSSANAGTYPITVTGTPLGKTTSFSLIINSSPDMFVSCNHTPVSAQVGNSINWSAVVSQTPSRAPYTYLWAGDAIPANETDQSFDITYSTTGLKSADATVRDSKGNVSHCIPVGTVNISVNPQFQEF